MRHRGFKGDLRLRHTCMRTQLRWRSDECESNLDYYRSRSYSGRHYRSWRILFKTLLKFSSPPTLPHQPSWTGFTQKALIKQWPIKKSRPSVLCPAPPQSLNLSLTATIGSLGTLNTHPSTRPLSPDAPRTKLSTDT
jgi:hypothetical protein